MFLRSLPPGQIIGPTGASSATAGNLSPSFVGDEGSDYYYEYYYGSDDVTASSGDGIDTGSDIADNDDTSGHTWQDLATPGHNENKDDGDSDTSTSNEGSGDISSDDDPDLLVTCINDMCNVDDTKEYHVEYYEDVGG